MNYIDYIIKKKKLFIPLTIVIIIAVSAVSVATHYLNKINYDRGDEPMTVYSDSTGNTIVPPPNGSENGGVPTEINSENYDIGHLKLDTDKKAQLEQADQQIKKSLDNSKIWSSPEVLNVLLAGIDNGSANYPYGRSDAMILVSLNKATKTIRLISLSRTAYVHIPEKNVNTRLSHSHGYGGAPLLIKTIEQNYKIDIDNYISTSFVTFTKIIDILGGCKVTLTAKEAKALKSKIQAAGLTYTGAGAYNLNGSLTLEYVRLRKIDTDRERTGRQRKVLTSVMNSIKGIGFNQARTLLDQILPLVTTDFSRGDIIQQGMAAFTKYMSWPIEQYVIPHKSSALQLIDNFEVVIVDWTTEIPYVQSLVYGGIGTSKIHYK